MDDAIGREEVELEVVPETEASAADRVQVIVGRRQDLGAWHGGDDSLRPRKMSRGSPGAGNGATRCIHHSPALLLTWARESR